METATNIYGDLTSGQTHSGSGHNYNINTPLFTYGDK